MIGSILIAFICLSSAAYCNNSMLKDLEELGYCVIPNVLSAVEAEKLYERVWHEYIEKAWPNCRLEDRSNWKDAFPIQNKQGIFAGPAGQIQVMWDLRQDPRIVNIFAQIWKTDDLIVSLDALSIMCPPEIREGYHDLWPHVDQKYQNPLLLIQGQFLFEDSFDGDGGFYCIPKSHLRFNEFAPELDEAPYEESWKRNNRYLLNFFNNVTDQSGNPYSGKHITAPRGSLILWDSRTVHWNQHASKTRPHIDSPRVRMVGYLLYIPKATLTDEERESRRKAFEAGVGFKLTKDNIIKEFERYLEDPGYSQPKINLTSLGESLLY